ncbi:MAG: hypothetical protein KME26_14890 [Oscillatoria princeps RMCB-10]|nr:hypothetical protein [Oscillatoria princeps RMCB-10]
MNQFCGWQPAIPQGLRPGVTTGIVGVPVAGAAAPGCGRCSTGQQYPTGTPPAGVCDALSTPTLRRCRLQR